MHNPKFIVCPRCKGTGQIDHPAFSNGFSREDFDEDPEFMQDYMHGNYDVPCPICDGNRVTTRKVVNAYNKNYQRKRDDWESEGRYLAGTAFGLQGLIDNAPDY